MSRPDKINEYKNSFQLKITLNKKEATNAGLIKGIVIFKNAWSLVAPSTLAACSKIKISLDKN